MVKITSCRTPTSLSIVTSRRQGLLPTAKQTPGVSPGLSFGSGSCAIARRLFYSSPFPLHFGQLTSPDPWHLTQSVPAAPANCSGEIRPVPSHFGHSIVSSPLHFGQVSICSSLSNVLLLIKSLCWAKTQAKLDSGINRSASLAGRANNLA